MKKIIDFNIKILDNILDIINSINHEGWNKKVSSINNETIGRHCRHIIDFYLMFIKGLENNLINYDLRERNYQIETNLDHAKKTINQIKGLLSNLDKKNQSINVLLNNVVSKSKLNSSIKRELMYIADHSIHHGHIIQIALQNEFHNLRIINKFYSPSTLESLECVQ